MRRLGLSRQSTPQTTASDHGVAGGPATKALTNEDGSKGNQKTSWVDYFLDHLPDWFVAVFTGFLVYVTNRLVKSTNKLWEAGEKQIAAARAAADAATVTAFTPDDGLVLGCACRSTITWATTTAPANTPTVASESIPQCDTSSARARSLA
jgi:hypothetical protein